MMTDAQKMEQLIKMAERMMEALQADIDALKVGRPKTMRMNEPDIQKLSILYSREIKSIDMEAARSLPLDLRRNFLAVTKKFRELLQLHMRYIKRVKNASEGIIRAVADDIHQKRNAMRTYTAPKSNYRPTASAIVYNAVV
ncbi:MAG: hypothetical protein WCD42_03875 [Rhizomicrobium sp.]